MNSNERKERLDQHKEAFRLILGATLKQGRESSVTQLFELLMSQAEDHGFLRGLEALEAGVSHGLSAESNETKKEDV